MHRLVPQFIVENYRAGRMRGSLKSVGMFLDLNGFSTMTDTLMQHGQHGAEVLAGLMHNVFDPLVGSIFEQGGWVVGFAGDGITALFPIGNDVYAVARRAVAAAWTIQQRMAANSVQHTVYGSFNFAVKIGLAEGDVEWGILASGAGGQATYYFRGEAVADSVEAEHRARAGDIILSRSLRDALVDEIETEPLASFSRLTGVKNELPLPAAVDLPSVDREISRLFVPDGVIAEGVRGEFRQVVNVFLKFPEFDDEQLQSFMQKVFSLQQRYGGLLSRLDFGDKGSTLLMLWGAPVAYENDVSRALNFVFDLQAGMDFPISVGVTYYIAHAGYLGSTLYEDYTCYGWGVNLAARFMTTAPEGSVWIDDRVARRIVSYFDLESVGSQRFKGFATEQKVYVLRARKTEVEPEYQGEMVGRETELARLQEFIAPLWEGGFAGSLVVWGDAGIGKGRLVYEFRSSPLFGAYKALWAICQADQIVRQPFNPFRYWLIHYCGITSRMNEAEKKQAFATKLDDLIAATSDEELARELERVRSVLGALMDLRWDDSFYEQLDAEGRYENTLLGLITLLKAESLRQPVILFWEDAQFVDDDSRNFLPRLKRALTAESVTYPVALIATSRRNGPALPFEEGLFDHNLELGALSVDAIARLAEILLGDVPSPDLVKLLVERSEGNPYFAEQIIYYLQEERLLEMSRTGWALVGRLDESVLPADISAVLVARLDQLAREVRIVIQTASVLGREFEVRVLARMLHDDGTLYDEIAEAEKAAIWAPLSQIRYLFTHGLLRDAAYAMQMQAHRRDLHRLAVNTLETLFAEEIRAHFAELAYHSEQAQLPDKALTYLRSAGDAARDAYQNTQALDYYLRALAFAPASDLQTQFDLRYERDKILRELRRPAERAKELDAMQILSEQIGSEQAQAVVSYRKALLANGLGNWAESLVLSEKATSMARAAGDEALVVDALLSHSLAFQRSGRFREAVDRGEDALGLARAHGNVAGEADVLTALGFVHIEAKDPVSGVQFLEQARPLYQSVGNVRGEVMVLNNLGLAATNQGKYGIALQHYEQSLHLARQIGSRQREAIILGNLGWISGLLGEYQKARLFSERQLVLAREMGDRYVQTLSLINLSGQVSALGYHTTAISFAEDGLRLARDSSDRTMEAWASTYLGHCFFGAGMLDAANDAYRSAVEICANLNDAVLETEPRAGLARTYLELNNLPLALESAEKILAHLAAGNSLDGTDDPARIYLSCYRVLDAAKDARAWPLIDAAYGLLNTRAASIPEPATRRSFLENIPHNREIIEIWEGTTRT
ncbi:MAG: tetratricopeptide repeat protein [Chloroflexota bacterium]